MRSEWGRLSCGVVLAFACTEEPAEPEVAGVTQAIEATPSEEPVTVETQDEEPPAGRVVRRVEAMAVGDEQRGGDADSEVGVELSEAQKLGWVISEEIKQCRRPSRSLVRLRVDSLDESVTQTWENGISFEHHSTSSDVEVLEYIGGTTNAPAKNLTISYLHGAHGFMPEIGGEYIVPLQATDEGAWTVLDAGPRLRIDGSRLRHLDVGVNDVLSALRQRCGG